MFVGNAALAFIIGLVYNSFADRVNNERLLLILIGLTTLWLVSVQGLLLHDVYGGPGGIVFPCFYLGFLAVADFTSLHILSYISDYYDTRSARRVLPFLLSAGFAGAIVAGLIYSCGFPKTVIKRQHGGAPKNCLPVFRGACACSQIERCL